MILPPANPDDAERVLSQIRYKAAISWSQYVPSRRDNIGDLVVNAFILVGVLLVFSTVAGVAFGGIRAISRRNRKDDPDCAYSPPSWRSLTGLVICVLDLKTGPSKRPEGPYFNMLRKNC